MEKNAQKTKQKNIDFVGLVPYAVTFSLLFIFATFGYIFFKGLNYGVDFRGGAEVQVKFSQSISVAELRAKLEEKGINGVTVQSIGESHENEFLLRVPSSEQNLNQVSDSISKALVDIYQQSGVEIRKTDIVGPKAGAELRISGLKAMFYAIIAISIYIGLRFDFRYAPGSIIALFHDVIIVLGVFAFTGKEFTLQIVAALLAIIGYSVNDTVVIYDRIREHEDIYSGLPLRDQINMAINQTMSRTILTSASTLSVCLAMLFWGGAAISDFFFAMTVGIISGAYSTVFVAAPITNFFDKIFKKKDESDKIEEKTSPV